jgi:urea carboxylase
MEPEAPVIDEVAALPPGGRLVEAGVPGNVWSVGVAPGDEVAEGHALVVLESMKMEIEVRAPVAARVHEVHCVPGKMVRAGQALVTLVPLEEASQPKLGVAS